MGLEGVRMALKVLREYYASKEEDAESLLQKDDGDFAAFMQQPKPPSAHTKSTGAAGGVIGILEVAESDFARNLAESRAAEDNAQEEYEKVSQDNKVATASKQQDVSYKNKEIAALKKFVSDTTEDLQGSSQELDAVNEYWEKLKDALQILEGEAVALVQRGSFLRRVHSRSA